MGDPPGDSRSRVVGFDHAGRARLRARAVRLEAFTVGWNLVEGFVALYFAILAGSIALLGFGAESFVETASGVVILWRFWAETKARDAERVDAIESRAQKLVAASLVLLGIYIAYEAASALRARERPDASVGGIVLTTLSLLVMGVLADAKRKTARRLGSRAMEADAFQTTACMILSAIVLVGIGLNYAFGWWWADPVAALAMLVPIGKEAKEAWEGESDCEAC